MEFCSRTYLFGSHICKATAKLSIILLAFLSDDEITTLNIRYKLI